MACIAVVGGGVAGLVCAWRLRRAGHDVEVLEREPAPGGRLRGTRRGGFRLTAVPAELGAGDRNLWTLMRALGIDADLVPLPPGRAAVWSGGRLEVPTRFGFLRASGLGYAARVRLAAALLLEGRRERSSPDRSRPEPGADPDAASAAAELSRRAGSEAAVAALAPLLELGCGAAPDALDWPGALRVWREGARPSHAFDAEALVSGLGAPLRVRSGCEVSSVETASGGARIRYRWRGRERSAWADAVVVALPGSEVAAVCPKLTPEERGFFETLAPRRALVAHLLLAHPPPGSLWREIAVPASEGLDLARIRLGAQTAAGVPAGAGLVSVALAEPASNRLWDASDAAVADLALESLAATPLGALAPHDFVVQRRLEVSRPESPASRRRRGRFRVRLERSPRLAFAGGYLAGGGLEGAVTGGMRAATAVARSLPTPAAARSA